MTLQVVGDDADGGKRDIGILDIDPLRPAGLVPIHADAGRHRQVFVFERAHVLERLL